MVPSGSAGSASPLGIALPAQHGAGRNHRAAEIADAGRVAPGAGPVALGFAGRDAAHGGASHANMRSEEHTSELQSLMRISYAVFCLKKKNNTNNKISTSKQN